MDIFDKLRSMMVERDSAMARCILQEMVINEISTILRAKPDETATAAARRVMERCHDDAIELMDRHDESMSLMIEIERLRNELSKVTK